MEEPTVLGYVGSGVGILRDIHRDCVSTSGPRVISEKAERKTYLCSRRADVHRKFERDGGKGVFVEN